jgi:hypothetical protein
LTNNSNKRFFELCIERKTEEINSFLTFLKSSEYPFETEFLHMAITDIERGFNLLHYAVEKTTIDNK